MKLAEWAKNNGISYLTAFRWFKAGTLPVKKAIQTESGTILVFEDETEEKVQPKEVYSSCLTETYQKLINNLPKDIKSKIEHDTSIKSDFINFCNHFSVKTKTAVDNSKKIEEEFEKIKNDPELYEDYLNLQKAQPKILTPEEFKDLTARLKEEEALRKIETEFLNRCEKINDKHNEKINNLSKVDINNEFLKSNLIIDESQYYPSNVKSIDNEFTKRRDDIYNLLNKEVTKDKKIEARLDNLENAIALLVTKIDTLAVSSSPTAEQMAELVTTEQTVSDPIVELENKARTKKVQTGIVATDAKGRKQGFCRSDAKKKLVTKLV